jgi:hypothetical protein
VPLIPTSRETGGSWSSVSPGKKSRPYLKINQSKEPQYREGGREGRRERERERKRKRVCVFVFRPHLKVAMKH